MGRDISGGFDMARELIGDLIAVCGNDTLDLIVRDVDASGEEVGPTARRFADLKKAICEEQDRRANEAPKKIKAAAQAGAPMDPTRADWLHMGAHDGLLDYLSLQR